MAAQKPTEENKNSLSCPVIEVQQKQAWTFDVGATDVKQRENGFAKTENVCFTGTVYEDGGQKEGDKKEESNSWKRLYISSHQFGDLNTGGHKSAAAKL